MATCVEVDSGATAVVFVERPGRDGEVRRARGAEDEVPWLSVMMLDGTSRLTPPVTVLYSRAVPSGLNTVTPSNGAVLTSTAVLIAPAVVGYVPSSSSQGRCRQSRGRLRRRPR